MDSSVPLMHHGLDRSWLADPDPDRPKGTHPKIQPKTIDLSNCRVCGVYSPEPHAEVYFVRLNFNISKLVYYGLLSRTAAGNRAYPQDRSLKFGPERVCVSVSLCPELTMLCWEPCVSVIGCCKRTNFRAKQITNQSHATNFLRVTSPIWMFWVQSQDSCFFGEDQTREERLFVCSVMLIFHYFCFTRRRDIPDGI